MALGTPNKPASTKETGFASHLGVPIKPRSDSPIVNKSPQFERNVSIRKSSTCEVMDLKNITEFILNTEAGSCLNLRHNYF